MCIYHIVCYCYALLWAISEVLIRIRVTLNFFPHNSLKFRHRARGRLRKNFHILIFEFNFALTHTYSISYIANTWAKIKGTSTWHTKMISVPSKMVAYCYRENLSYFLGFIPVYFFQNTYPWRKFCRLDLEKQFIYHVIKHHQQGQGHFLSFSMILRLYQNLLNPKVICMILHDDKWQQSIHKIFSK